MLLPEIPNWLKLTGFLAIMTLFALAFLQTYLRTQTTLLGYEIGVLKKKEARLLEESSELKMKLSALSTKQSLQLLSKTAADHTPQ